MAETNNESGQALAPIEVSTPQILEYGGLKIGDKIVTPTGEGIVEAFKPRDAKRTDGTSAGPMVDVRYFRTDTDTGEQVKGGQEGWGFSQLEDFNKKQAQKAEIAEEKISDPIDLGTSEDELQQQKAEKRAEMAGAEEVKPVIDEFDQKAVEYNKNIDEQIANLKQQKEHLAEKRRSETRVNEKEMLMAQEQLNRTELHRLEAEKETNAQFSSDLERWNHLLENTAEIFAGKNELQERISGAGENVDALKINLGKNYHEMMGRDIEEGIKGVEQELIHYEYDNLPRQMWSEATKTWAEEQSQINHPSLPKDEFGRGGLTLSRRENPAEKEFNEKVLPGLLERVKQTEANSLKQKEEHKENTDENAELQRQLDEANQKIASAEAKARKFENPPQTPEEWAEMPEWIKEMYQRDIDQKKLIEDGEIIAPTPEPEPEAPQNDLRSRLRLISDYALGGGLGAVAALGGGVISTEILTQMNPVLAFHAGEYVTTGFIILANTVAERAREWGVNHPHLLRAIRGASGGALATCFATTVASALEASGINVIPNLPTGGAEQVVEKIATVVPQTPDTLNLPPVQEGQNLSTMVKDFLHLNNPQEIYRHTVETILGNLDKLPPDKVGAITGLDVDKVMHDRKLFRMVMDAGRIIQPGQVFTIK